ncbi:MAG: DUF6448 family protein [Candidatus Rifleibacteriota bacterium]
MQILNVKNLLVAVAIATLMLGVSSGIASAHCDTENGPTAIDARKALETNDFKKAAIWVGEKQTPELRESFEKSIHVYKMGGKAKELAERYFMSTTVRLHREAEGMSFTGLKPAQPLPPIIAKAEKALNEGNLKPVTDILSAELEKEIQGQKHRKRKRMG